MADKNLKYTRANVDRAKQVRRDNDKIQEKKVGLYEIDEAVKYYFDEVVKLQVTDSSGLVTKVPVMYANQENWKNVQKSDLRRDARGKIQLPVVSYRRDSITKDRNLGNKVDVNEPIYISIDQGYNKQTRYDRHSVMQDMLRGRKKSMLKKKLIVPDYLTVTYNVVVHTEFLTQMNTLIESISYNEGSYWGDKHKYLVRAKIDDFPNVVEINIGEDRVVKSEFTLTINGHIIPSNIQQKASLGSIKSFTKAVVKLNENVISDISDVDKQRSLPNQSNGSNY